MSDRRYQHIVAGVPLAKMPEQMRTSLAAVQKTLPKGTGVALFVFDFGDGGGISYISNGVREDVVRTLRDWLSTQASDA